MRFTAARMSNKVQDASRGFSLSRKQGLVSGQRLVLMVPLAYLPGAAASSLDGF